MQSVLIVDDDEDTRVLVEATLRDVRYRTLTARDGEEALKIVRTDRPVLVLLDVMMPGMDGFEVCRLLKNEPANAGIKVVMVTARTQRSDRARGREVRADEYFTKPFSPLALLDKVDEVLGQSAD